MDASLTAFPKQLPWHFSSMCWDGEPQEDFVLKQRTGGQQTGSPLSSRSKGPVCCSPQEQLLRDLQSHILKHNVYCGFVFIIKFAQKIEKAKRKEPTHQGDHY